MTDALLRAEDVRVSRRGFRLDAVSLEIGRGSVVGLVGPNGAGKTTLIRAILGLVSADGRIDVFGSPAGSRAGLARTGVVLDRPMAAGDWRVRSLGRRLAPFYPTWDEGILTRLLDRFEVPTSGRVDELSRGQATKLSLALAMAHLPDLLVLDEPSSGLDPASRREIGDVLREFMTDPTHSVLFSTHITADLERLADQVVVLVDGRVAHHGSMSATADAFALARGTGAPPGPPVVGARREPGGWTALVRTFEAGSLDAGIDVVEASIDDIVIHLAATGGRSTA